jgi:P27 family predicted phage terminase small subunit
MRRGPKPVPTRLNILRGNPSRRPLNTDEPTPPPLGETVPPELEDEPQARAEWERLAPGLIACGQVTLADRALLIGYCLKYGQWLHLEDVASKEDPIVEGSTGNPIVNPTHRHANALFELVLRAAGELGLTPASRSRVTKAPTAPAVSKWAGALP